MCTLHWYFFSFISFSAKTNKSLASCNLPTSGIDVLRKAHTIAISINSSEERERGIILGTFPGICFGLMAWAHAYL